MPLIEYHHETFNGRGYPYGLKGENIPLGSRIIGLCDAFCALTAIRPHRKAYTVDEALQILQTQMQGAWDPLLLSSFTQMVQLAQKQFNIFDSDFFSEEDPIDTDFATLFTAQNTTQAKTAEIA